MTTTSQSSPAQLSKEMAGGAFVRQGNAFSNRITADGSSGYRAEPGRYHLYVCLACPWAHRSVIVRRLLGLEDVVGLSLVDPIRDDRGWAFTTGFEDPVNGFTFLRQAYDATDADYEGRWTVPTLWDRQTGRIATNDYPHITLDLETEFAEWHRPGAPELYPAHLREEIDAVNAVVFETVNNGVYKAGFATEQAAYEDAYDALFATFDDLERRLTDQRYLVGGQLSEADVRLFTTLVRFDAVYHGHFKCNERKLVEYPALWAYARDLFAITGFGDTTDFDQIKRHYYATHDRINPTRVVPKGPATDWTLPSGRDQLP